MWDYNLPVHPNTAFLSTVTKELLSLMVSLTAFHWFFTIFLRAKPCCIYRVESNEASDLGPYCTKTAVARSSFHVPGFFASVLISSTSNATLLV
jgi:hypothetical protein